ncbi:NAD(P)-dependent oxidoreductase [uncultured Faecalibaculum sp.]|uniref:NAD(P)-dependent oxidoreductase n=1 Tax=uncultured Faecalibaculum sp. TaxID=1729681 RepID=UPI0025E9E256|nr:NAD(P)H-binding protein [uncultured Faecalibaculum sp.]
MKIAVIGANGRAGRLIANALADRGQDVTAVVRESNRTRARFALCKDALELTARDLAGYDVVIDALGGWAPETMDTVWKGAQHLASILSACSTRLLVVGGAGSLYTSAERTQTVTDAPDFPELFKPVAAAHDRALKDLQNRTNLDWTCVSPAADFQPDEPQTGNVIHAGEEFTVNKDGKSMISYLDYADAFVNEVLNGHHVRERISFLQS